MNKKKSILLIIAVIAICFFIYLFKGNFNKGDYSQTYYDLNTVSEITLYNVKESDSKEILKKCGDILLNIDNTMSKTREASDVYKINQNDNNESFSVNFPTSSESDTSVEAIGENSNIVYGKSNLKSGFNLTPIFILLAMLVVAFEWILYKKGN